MDFGALQDFVLFAIGRTPVTLGGIVAGLAIIAAGLVLARLAGAGIRRVRGRARHGAAALYIVEKLVTYGLVLIGFVAGLSTVGLDLSSLAVFAGALGVGLGLGLQGIVKEFVSGLVLIFDRALSVGDFVELEDGKRGVVQEVGPRAVRIRTNDNIDLVIPNSKFIEGPVVNWTLHGHTRRIHIPFQVAYGCDREKVREVVLAAGRTVPFTLPETDVQKSQVWMTGFGDSGVQFELVVWPTLDAVKRPAAMHAAYTWAIAEALERAGVEIPLPQVDVRLRSLFGQEGEAARRSLRLEEAAGPEARRLRRRPPSTTPPRTSRGRSRIPRARRGRSIPIRPEQGAPPTGSQGRRQEAPRHESLGQACHRRRPRGRGRPHDLRGLRRLVSPGGIDAGAAMRDKDGAWVSTSASGPNVWRCARPSAFRGA